MHDENDKMPTKTPSRMGQAGAGGTGKAALLNTARLGLGARTEGKDKNVLGLGGGKTPGPSKDNQGQGGKGAGGGKGKEKDAEDIGTCICSSPALPLGAEAIDPVRKATEVSVHISRLTCAHDCG